MSIQLDNIPQSPSIQSSAKSIPMDMFTSFQDSTSIYSKDVNYQLDEYTKTMDNDKLIEAIEFLARDVKRFDLENHIFETFLKANEPTLIVGMQQILDCAQRLYMGERVVTIAQPTVSIESQTSDGTRGSREPRTSIMLALDRPSTHKINTNLRTDLVLRSVEEMQLQLEKFIRKTHRKKCNLKAELEEISIRLSETEDAKDMFEQTVIVEGTDPITQRIAAEKFIKYMNDWIKSAQFTIDKMRLRCTTSKQKLAKLSNLLLQKEELGENVHEVDFEKITIENQHFQKNIEQKNSHLIELKRMCGNANLVLTTHKNFLQVQVDELNGIKKAIRNCQRKTLLLDSESERAEAQVQEEQEALEALKELVDNYRVPDVMEYVKLKNEVHETRRLLKIWHRKTNIQTITLSTTKNKLVKLLGLNNAKDILRKLKKNETVSSEDYIMPTRSDELNTLNVISDEFKIDF